MASLRFKWFVKPKFLKSAGKATLGKFLSRFATALKEKNIHLPSPEKEDDVYYRELAEVFIHPEGLPDDINTTLYQIEELANEDGQERLEDAVEQAELGLKFGEEASSADIAIQVWLKDPKLFADEHNKHRMLQLSSFEYYGATEDGELAKRKLSNLKPLIAQVDGWCAEHNRGTGTTRIESYLLGDEHWFMIRHGDPYARTPKIEKGKTEVLHFRPEKDDVVVYSPAQNEIRINARTKGEKDLYRKAFGQHFFDDPNYFSQKKAYTLAPLCTQGRDALDVTGVAGIKSIILREIEIFWGGEFNKRETSKAEDLFGAWEQDGKNYRMPESAKDRITKATFYVLFDDNSKPRKVQIRTPNILSIGRHSDFHAINDWLTKKGFRAVLNPTTPKNVKALA